MVLSAMRFINYDSFPSSKEYFLSHLFSFTYSFVQQTSADYYCRLGTQPLKYKKRLGGSGTRL